MKKTVLLVDDDANDIDLMLYALDDTRFPYDVIVARDGQGAMEYLWAEGEFTGRDRREAPELVILDLKMPRVGGLEVLKRIREDDELKHLKVMILTSSDEHRDQMAALKLGADHYVRKPSNFEGFLDLAKRFAELVSERVDAAIK